MSARSVRLEQRQRCARAALVAFAAGNPDVIFGKRCSEGLDLAQRAACGLVDQPQRTGGVALIQVVLRRADAAHIGEAKLPDQFLAVFVGGAEQLAGVDEQHRQGGIDARNQVQQHDGIGAETGDQRDALAGVFGKHGLEHAARAGLVEALAQRLCVTRRPGLRQLALMKECVSHKARP